MSKPIKQCLECRHANLCRVWYQVSTALRESVPLAGGKIGVQPRVEFELGIIAVVATIGHSLGTLCKTYVDAMEWD